MTSLWLCKSISLVNCNRWLSKSVVLVVGVWLSKFGRLQFVCLITFFCVHKSKLFVHISELIGVFCYFFLLRDGVLPVFIANVWTQAFWHFFNVMLFDSLEVLNSVRIVSCNRLNVLLALCLAATLCLSSTKSSFECLICQYLLACFLNWGTLISLHRIFSNSSLRFWSWSWNLW